MTGRDTDEMSEHTPGKPLVPSAAVDVGSIQDQHDDEAPPDWLESAPAAPVPAKRGRKAAPKAEPLAPEVEEVLERRAAKKAGKAVAWQVLVRAGFDKGHQSMEAMGLHRVLLMQEMAVRLKYSVELDPEFAPGIDRLRPMTINDIGREYERLTKMFDYVPEGKEEGINLCQLKYGPLQGGGLLKAIRTLHEKYAERLEQVRKVDPDADLTERDFWDIIAAVGGRPTDEDVIDQYDATSIGLTPEEAARL
jgi:hypothetical protein